MHTAANNQIIFIVKTKTALQNTFAAPGFEMYAMYPYRYVEWI